MNGKDAVKKTKPTLECCYSIENKQKLESLHGKRFKVSKLPDNIYRSTVTGAPPGINIFKTKDNENKTLNRMNKKCYPKGK